MSSAPNVTNGTFTASHPNYGHFTVKVHTAMKGDLVGKRIVSLLTGPNNERDFKGVGFWDDEKKIAFVWKRFRSDESRGGRVDGYTAAHKGANVIERKLQIWTCLATRGTFDELGEWSRGSSYWGSEGYTLQRAGHCVYCNRKLTDPISIATGVGPDCREKYSVEPVKVDRIHGFTVGPDRHRAARRARAEGDGE